MEEITIKTNFEVIKKKSWKKRICWCCLKKFNRQKTFEQTISPFNKNKKGKPKTKEKILQELDKEVRDWKNIRFTCEDCENIKWQKGDPPKNIILWLLCDDCQGDFVTKGKALPYKKPKKRNGRIGWRWVTLNGDTFNRKQKPSKWAVIET
jgi:hypothetical protein